MNLQCQMLYLLVEEMMPNNKEFHLVKHNLCVLNVCYHKIEDSEDE